MRRADGCLWVRGVGCACRPWWIPRLVARLYGDITVRWNVRCAPYRLLRRLGSAGTLLTAMAEAPFSYFQNPGFGRLP